MTAKIKTGDVQMFKGQQDICYKALLRMTLGGTAHSLRVEIRYDSYQDQSWGKIERWNGSEWKEVFTLSGRQLRGYDKGLCYRRQAPSLADFALDLATLEARAEEVLR